MSFQTIEDEEWETYLYLRQLKRQWRMEMRKPIPSELLKIFPDSKSVIAEKIQEWQVVRDTLTRRIQKDLTHIKQLQSDDFSKWFLREWVKVTDGKKLLEAENHIERLKRLLRLGKKDKKPKDWITDEQKEMALAVPIEEVLDRNFRRTGRTIVTHCPFHDERSPSFTVYTDQNRYFCFGCQTAGDVINLIQELHNLKFKDAVLYLIA